MELPRITIPAITPEVPERRALPAQEPAADRRPNRDADRRRHPERRQRAQPWPESHDLRRGGDRRRRGVDLSI